MPTFGASAWAETRRNQLLERTDKTWLRSFRLPLSAKA